MNALSRIKTKKCKSCGNDFIPFQTTQAVCGVECAIYRATALRIAKDKKDNCEAKAKLKTRQQHLNEAQSEFNRFIRLRDALAPCISCLRFHSGQYHAGHYRSVGSSPHLRFCENNVHKQCSACNNHLSGNILNYRKCLIAKIGLEAVERLEADNEAKHYTIEEIQVSKLNTNN